MAPANVPLDPLLQDLGTQQAESQPSQPSQTTVGASQTEVEEVGTKRSASYSENEDVQLCRSWIVISEDPLVGTHQDGTTFWKRVHHSYSKNLPESRRTAGSLKAHWVALQKPISKFRGFVNQKASFKYLRVYNILVKVPKWNSYTDENTKKNQLPVQKKRARSPSSDAPASTALTSEPVSDAEANSTDASSVQRPMGKKKAKLIHKLANKEDNWKCIIARAHESVANESKRQNDIFNKEAWSLNEMAQTSKTNTQVSIMDKDLSNLDDDSKEYFRLKKREILASLRSNTSSSS
ncbi:uncharacterized protein PGTG_22735 [Puccinia graminis f. sp. tritici CRL 75-36-700-3]|uniref:No apical meristem-associated C-terminal domain-containing protein n=1 Tax=Puccinia graminis f. sp. tritici (strain CRL 75-36-700-3 / race SCCL) TaxID=418459 RepID=H6QVF5_PUCGT|nr:uncharacterized protein PGTG_22735 [Puccinia graminis f. sp. tritici CRL 75-36-700-3]EHS62909.1 hypothetical protein PGTG_22735 [Puccinia graminis f. sp. tritici CRL 75-36-700-3]